MKKIGCFFILCITALHLYAQKESDPAVVTGNKFPEYLNCDLIVF